MNKIKALQKLDSNTFRNSVLGLGAGAAALMLVATAQAGNEVCLPLNQENGQILNAASSALVHSDRQKGTVAIAAFPGRDLYETPSQLRKYFTNRQTAADCFINNSMLPNGGSHMSLYVNGQAIVHNGKDMFSIGELRSTPEILENARVEATLGRILLESNQPPP